MQAFTWALNTICRTVVPRPTGGRAPIGDWRLMDIVTDTIERFREVRCSQGTGAAGVHLRAVIEGALETGMRRGEILSLQWKQVEGLKVDGSTLTWAARAELVLPWTKTKTRRDRRIPISSRLKGILEMRRLDPAGQPMPADRYVFRNEIGQRVQSVKRAWARAVLKAHRAHADLY